MKVIQLVLKIIYAHEQTSEQRGKYEFAEIEAKAKKGGGNLPALPSVLRESYAGFLTAMSSGAERGQSRTQRVACRRAGEAKGPARSYRLIVSSRICATF